MGIFKNNIRNVNNYQVGRVLHKEMKGGVGSSDSLTSLTAYILIALLETGMDTTVGICFKYCFIKCFECSNYLNFCANIQCFYFGVLYLIELSLMVALQMSTFIQTVHLNYINSVRSDYSSIY